MSNEISLNEISLKDIWKNVRDAVNSGLFKRSKNYATIVDSWPSRKISTEIQRKTEFKPDFKKMFSDLSMALIPTVDYSSSGVYTSQFGEVESLLHDAVQLSRSGHAFAASFGFERIEDIFRKEEEKEKPSICRDSALKYLGITPKQYERIRDESFQESLETNISDVKGDKLFTSNRPSYDALQTVNRYVKKGYGDFEKALKSVYGIKRHDYESRCKELKNEFEDGGYNYPLKVLSSDQAQEYLEL